MKGIEKAIKVITNCNLPGYMFSLEADIDLSAWNMLIHDGADVEYHLCPYHNGGYLLYAQAAVPQAVISHNSQEVMITRDPEKDMCHIFLPKLTVGTLMNSMKDLRITLRKAGIDNGQRE